MWIVFLFVYLFNFFFLKFCLKSQGSCRFLSHFHFHLFVCRENRGLLSEFEILSSVFVRLLSSENGPGSSQWGLYFIFPFRGLGFLGLKIQIC